MSVLLAIVALTGLQIGEPTGTIHVKKADVYVISVTVTDIQGIWTRETAC